jgi:uncharacterized repeat protein (TIGR03803 family)
MPSNQHPPKRSLPWLAVALAAAAIPPTQAATESVLHAFAPPPRGANPFAVVIRDSAGNIYGTAEFGGASNAGLVFKLNASGQQTILYTFTGGLDGGNPISALTTDWAGNFYASADQKAGGGIRVPNGVAPSTSRHRFRRRA